jgi:prepilin-type processing-associated H-X9-DG protein
MLLPFLEQEALAKEATEAYRLDPGGNTTLHDSIRMASLPVLLCPTESRSLGGFTATSQWALTTYRGVAGTGLKNEDGVFQPKLTVSFLDITDGTATTLMIGERPPGSNGVYGGWYAGWGIGSACPLAQILPASHNPWVDSDARDCGSPTAVYRPGRLDDLCDVNHFWSQHSGGANFAFADGSVRFLRYSADDILPALATRAGGEAVTVPE